VGRSLDPVSAWGWKKDRGRPLRTPLSSCSAPGCRRLARGWPPAAAACAGQGGGPGGRGCSTCAARDVMCEMSEERRGWGRGQQRPKRDTEKRGKEPPCSRSFMLPNTFRLLPSPRPCPPASLPHCCALSRPLRNSHCHGPVRRAREEHPRDDCRVHRGDGRGARCPLEPRPSNVGGRKALEVSKGRRETG
jgi:hypothetical protein